MKILFLATSLQDEQAGAAHHSLELINVLASRPDVRLSVFATAVPDRVRSVAQVTDYRWPAPLPALWRVDHFWEVPRLARELRRHALPEVDVCYTRNTQLGLALRAIAPGVPIISHIGSVIASRELVEEADRAVATRWYTRLQAREVDRQERRSYREKDWLHLVSTPMVARTREEVHKLPAGFFQVCPLGSSTRRFDRRAHARSDARKAHGIPNNAVVFLSVARLTRWKNIDLVVRALAELRGDDAWLVIVGGGQELENLRQLAVECGVADRTVFTSQVAEPQRYYAASDVFVLPSQIESFGNVYAEAMLMGLPCIGMRYAPPRVLSSAEDVIPEGKAGYCISDLAELVERLRQLTAHEELRRSLGESAYRHALQSYTIERYAETVLALARSRFAIV